MGEVGSDELRDAAVELGLTLDAAEREALARIGGAVLSSIDTHAGSGLAAPPRPTDDRDDPCNAVVRWCDVPPHGGVARVGESSPGTPPATRNVPLDGLRVAVKESLAVAGLPLTCGSNALRDFVPTEDSAAVERLRAAGARVVAQTNMDDLAFSGSGTSSRYGPVRNPYDLDRSAGGSSGGSAAVLHYPDVDAALGTDQAGSIRIPAAWCGVYGLKPTYGLVPYTGGVGLDPTVDHVGPLARDVGTLGRVLDAIAGPDGRDPRQPPDTGLTGYAEAAERCLSLRDLRLGVLSAAFDERVGTSEPVAEAAREVLDRLADRGAFNCSWF